VLRALLLLLASWVARLAAVDYEALRVEARNLFASKIEEVRGSIATMQKAQRAAEQALDMCVLPTRSCVPSFLLPARRRGAGMSDLAARLQLREFEIARVALVCCLASCASGAHARFMFRRRSWLASARGKTHAREGICVALRPASRAQPFDMMKSVWVLCLALCVFSLCSGTSLRVERHGLTREGNLDNIAFMLVNGKSGAQEMCLVIAGGARSVSSCARGPWRHAA
jgi:hypothetical protein